MHYTACWGAKTGDSAACLKKKIQLCIFVENINEMQSMGGGGTTIIHMVPLVAKVKPQDLLNMKQEP